MTQAGARLVCLVGIDGTGKTSHAKRFVTDAPFAAKSRYLRLRAPNLLSIPFMVFCRAIGMTEVHHFRDGSSSSEHHYYRNRVVAAVWPWIQFFDAVISVVFLVYIPMMSGVVLVCDRFLHDLIIDLMVDTGSSTLHKRMVGKLILHLVPRQSLVFVLDVDESIILMRKNDIPSMDYLRKRRKLYRLLAAYLDLPLLDCSQPFDVVHNTLTKCMSLAGCF